jgi:hypothetical protein
MIHEYKSYAHTFIYMYIYIYIHTNTHYIHTCTHIHMYAPARYGAPCHHFFLDMHVAHSSRLVPYPLTLTRTLIFLKPYRGNGHPIHHSQCTYTYMCINTHAKPHEPRPSPSANHFLPIVRTYIYTNIHERNRPCNKATTSASRRCKHPSKSQAAGSDRTDKRKTKKKCSQMLPRILL